MVPQSPLGSDRGGDPAGDRSFLPQLQREWAALSRDVALEEVRGALRGRGEGADPHPDAKRLCAEKDNDLGWLPLQLSQPGLAGARDRRLKPLEMRDQLP